MTYEWHFMIGVIHKHDQDSTLKWQGVHTGMQIWRFGTTTRDLLVASNNLLKNVCG